MHRYPLNVKAHYHASSLAPASAVPVKLSTHTSNPSQPTVQRPPCLNRTGRNRSGKNVKYYNTLPHSLFPIFWRFKLAKSDRASAAKIELQVLSWNIEGAHRNVFHLASLLKEHSIPRCFLSEPQMFNRYYYIGL